MKDTRLTPELEKIRQEVREYAVNYGLDFYPTLFEMLDWKDLNMVAAYGGFPNRYPHWRFGMEYENLMNSYTYGLSKIYELVINNDPSYAYLLNCNKTVDQKLVMAHVFGHVDFFKNNSYFAHTNRKMMDQMANHKVRVKRHINNHGFDQVERFIDICHSLENLIDHHGPYIQRVAKPEEAKEERESLEMHKLKSAPYMDRYVNPKEFLESQRKHKEEERAKKKNFPENPVQDVLGFLAQNAPLENWQRDILNIIRDEAYYFLPQGQTKIMNEGWASYWHSTIMTQKAVTAAELVDFADHHAGTLAQQAGRLNPYKLGIELFRDIEERWNQGKFGKEYDECTDLVKKKNWNTHANLGRQKIFEVRRIHNDITFIDTFLTEEFCRENKLFYYMYNKSQDEYIISNRDYKMIKAQLLNSLTNWGQPYIYITDGNHGNRGELYLKHRHEGVDLKIDYAMITLENLYQIWKRPVSLETIIEDKKKVFFHDGKEVKQEDKQAEI